MKIFVGRLYNFIEMAIIFGMFLFSLKIKFSTSFIVIHYNIITSWTEKLI